jgi:hypothetical protein
LGGESRYLKRLCKVLLFQILTVDSGWIKIVLSLSYKLLQEMNFPSGIRENVDKMRESEP